MIPRTTLLALLAVAGLVAVVGLAPTATAQEEGVFVDPDSPAGKEYAIPLDQARRDASGKGNAARRDSEGNDPLFGTGIERAEGAGGASAGAPESTPHAASRADESSGTADPSDSERPADGNRRPKAKRPPERDRAAGDDGPSLPEAAVEGGRRAAVVESTAGGSDTLPTALVAAVVLAAGLLVGFGLRKLLRNS